MSSVRGMPGCVSAARSASGTWPSSTGRRATLKFSRSQTVPIFCRIGESSGSAGRLAFGSGSIRTPTSARPGTV
ncbi:hypothetical protein OV079_14560 [Nannocystis pusilla]|uniref:Uncharacterized protein n=1 Tax=Nannocystis pusilla TaxID=889268 RepID=A0A9X3EMI1_9BACT|nr:hypothetical protein [Nannocystis pusilla]MCY1006752.1 hypothetical protein [Nannocystis pusilla]